MKDLVNLENKEVVTNSRRIAEVFGKRHDHILRDIESLIKDISHSPKMGNETTNMFIKNTYINKKKQKQPEYIINRDGFSLLAMGFTGKEALKWKLKYIEAFNKMEESLKSIDVTSDIALTNEAMKFIGAAVSETIDAKLNVYEDNYRPTHANKIALNNYIKRGLGDLREDGEVDLVKDRILLILNGEKWQDVPLKTITQNMNIVDESIRGVKSLRDTEQLSFLIK